MNTNVLEEQMDSLNEKIDRVIDLLENMVLLNKKQISLLDDIETKLRLIESNTDRIE